MRLSDRITSVRAVSGDVRVDDNRYAPVPRDSQIIFYERDGFEGRSLTVDDPLDDLRRSGFNDRASSVMVVGQRWEICEDVRFQGRCVVLRPGRYTSLAAMGLSDRVSSARAVDRDGRADTPPAPPAPVAAQVVFYEREGFEGRLFTADSDLDNFGRTGFNDRASSAVVMGGRWEACSEAGYRGRCVVLRPGRYTSLSAMGMNNSVSSVRTVGWGVQVNDNQYAPTPVTVYDNRRRNDERMYEANITSARAVVGAPEQRCWVERERVVQNSGNANVGGALAGALIGGILGHQVGGGTGKDIATFGGAMAGAVVGSNVGRDAQGQTAYDQNVQRCSSVSGPVTPAYWEVYYSFRGQEHRVQMMTQPGPTITVNERGEPRA
ncbi:MAG: glycine zipper 2TM domain-containing protein [Rhodoferax sp.]|nr:glycine zipper 2TM domain-containing protein [Rhodoferax sp.]